MTLTIKKVKIISKIHRYLFLVLIMFLTFVIPPLPIEISLFQMFFLVIILFLIYVLMLSLLDRDTKDTIISGINEKSKPWEQSLFEALQKKYTKINKKRVRKGEQPLCQKQIIDRIKKEQKRFQVPLLIMFIVLLFQFLFLVWIQYKNGIELISFLLTIFLFVIIIVFISMLGRRKEYTCLIKKLENEEIMFLNSLENRKEVE